MKIIYLIFCLVLIGEILTAQPKANHEFTDVHLIECTPTKSQYFTGTCWNFSTLSFLESENLRSNNLSLDLSELFVVRYNYFERAIKYVRLKGKLHLGQGSQAHDAIAVIRKYGIVPEQVYPMPKGNYNTVIHAEFNNALKGMLDGIIENPFGGIITENYIDAINSLLDVYFGKVPSEFEYEGNKYTAESFRDQQVQIDFDDYIEIVSLQHEPMYKKVPLDVPDNWRGDANYYNVKVEDLINIVDKSLSNGYSVVWDGDVTNSSYDVSRTKYNLNFENNNEALEDLISKAGKNRMKHFNTWRNTDDHLMHIIGISVDSNQVEYYKLKDSAGQNHPNVYLSKPYFAAKTIAIMVNKNALSNEIRKKLKL